MTDKKNKSTQLLIRLPEDELEQIRINAKVCDKTVSAYIRELALNMCLIENDYSCIERHTAQISAYRNAINQLIFTIKKTGNYTPVDLEYILNKTNEILKSENKFLDMYEKLVESEKKLIARTVRQIVRENIKKTNSTVKRSDNSVTNN